MVVLGMPSAICPKLNPHVKQNGSLVASDVFCATDVLVVMLEEVTPSLAVVVSIFLFEGWMRNIYTSTVV